MFEIAIACLIITALAAWVNARFIRLPNTIGVMAIAMLISLALLIADRLGYGEWYHHERRLMESVDFSAVLMNGMLSILLFAGALHVDVSLLGKYRKQVASLALVGTAVSTLIIGFFLCWVLPMIGLPLSLGYCLLFGALISPTDPIAVTGIYPLERSAHYRVRGGACKAPFITVEKSTQSRSPSISCRRRRLRARNCLLSERRPIRASEMSISPNC